MEKSDFLDDRDRFLPDLDTLPKIAPARSTDDMRLPWREIVTLSHKLRADTELLELLTRAGVADADLAQVIADLSRFPWTALYHPASESRDHAAALRQAVVDFTKAVERFEEASGERLPSLNAALPELVGHGGDTGREHVRKVLAEDAGTAWVRDYLGYIGFLIDEGELSASCPDPLIRLPAGGWSKKAHTRAAWLAIRAIRNATGEPSGNPAFHSAVVRAVELMAGHMIDVNDVAAMLANEARAASKKNRKFARR